MRTARSTFYDGGVYGRIIDPLLHGVRGFVSERLPAGERVVEACCGTGALARQLARSGRTVVGVDLSPRNIEYARQQSASEGFTSEQLRFEVGDVAGLEIPPPGPYDLATIVLALHEMPSQYRVPVLRALCRIAARVMVVDYAIPMPWNFAGVRNRGLEVAAGVEHFSAFRDFGRRRGLPGLFEETGITIESDRRIDSGTLQVAVVKASPT